MSAGRWLRACLGLAMVIAAADARAFGTTRVATGLSRPVFATSAPGDPTRVFVVEQHTGAIKVLQFGTWTLGATPFLTVPGLSTASEGGLLGLAFHPDYATNGYFYVYITTPDTRVLRYQVSSNPELADPDSAFQIIGFDQPESNHNGGWLGFGVDGYLYIASGDGGGGNDAHGTIGNAQDLDSKLGKILRIDVNSDDFPLDPDQNYGIPASNPFASSAGDDAIWVYGLRNPWRASFDRATQDLYIGDVGQDHCEEISFQYGTSPGGENYGWRLREGVIATPTGGVGGPPPPDAVDPIMDYPQGSTSGFEPCSGPGVGFIGNSVTGGYVYRGPVSELVGRYFFADFFGDSLWSFVFDGSAVAAFDGTNYTDLVDHSGEAEFTPNVGTLDFISSFGEDAAGNLYVLDLIDGEVFFVPEPVAALQMVAGVIGLSALAELRRRRRGSGDRGSESRVAGTRTRKRTLRGTGAERLASGDYQP